MGPLDRLRDPESRAALLTVLVVAVLALVLVRCVVGVAPQVYWDVDPRSVVAPTASTVLGPAPAAWLNVLSVAVAAAALAGHVAVGGRISAAAAVLAGLGMAACLWHGYGHAEDLRRGGAWIGAAALALAGYHLAQHEGPRRSIAAGLVALLVALTLQAVVYVYVQHPATVRHFELREQEIIESRGWTLGSSQHELFERRLRSPDATGAFALSNVLGSVAVGLTLLAAALAIGGARLRNWRGTWPAALLAAAGVWTVYLTRSKGAALALVAGGVLMLWAWWGPLWRRRRYGLSTAAVLLIVLSVSAVLVRGALGPPETHLGERSILFRYHYWQGTARALGAASWGDVAAGLGMGGFQQVYPRYKEPLSPEDVDSAHNVFVDNVAMLGVGGLAWSALLLWWLWRSGVVAQGAAAARPPPDAGVPRRNPRNASADDDGTGVGVLELRCALVLAVIVFGLQLVLEHAELLATSSFVAWSFGGIGFIAAFTWLATPGRAAPESVAVGLFAASAALLAHGQIEMTFFQEQGAVLAFFIVATAAAKPAESQAPLSPVNRLPGIRWLAPAVVAGLALVMIVAAAIPLTRQQRSLKVGAEALRPPLEEGDVAQALTALDAAIAVLPTDPTPYVWKARLLAEARDDRSAALAALDDAERAGLGDLALLYRRAQLLTQSPDDEERAQAVAAWQRVLAAHPYAWQPHFVLANLYWDMDRQADAKALYRRCLELDEQAYLDPAKHLPDGTRRQVEAKLNQ